MTKQEVFAWVEEQYGVTPDCPFTDDDIPVLRHSENKKWFALIMNVEYACLGINKSGRTDILNVKCDPFLVTSLAQKKGYMRAYHMNKQKWLTILLDGSVKADEVKSLIAMSFELTGTKKNRRPKN